MKVFIIESNDASDFYKGRLDGASTLELLKLLGIKSTIRFALDEDHFMKAMEEATAGDYDVVHISCHGDEAGIQLNAGDDIEWSEFVKPFQNKSGKCPRALVMSSCRGAARGVGLAFAQSKSRPKIIFGSTDDLAFSEYAVAWALLYKEIKRSVSRDNAQEALKKICATVSDKFRYLRWHDGDEVYKTFPGSRVFKITESD